MQANNLKKFAQIAAMALGVAAMSGAMTFTASAESGGEGPGVNSNSKRLPNHPKNMSRYDSYRPMPAYRTPWQPYAYQYRSEGPDWSWF